MWLLLRALDQAVGFSFRGWIENVSGLRPAVAVGADADSDAVVGEVYASDGNAMAVAVYLGARFVGAAILFGLLFS